MINRILKFYLIGMLLIVTFISPECKKKEDRKVFTLPPITVRAKQNSFWYEDKKIKYVLKFDHFFIGVQDYRVSTEREEREKHRKTIGINSYYNLNRFGIRDRYKKEGEFTFLLSSEFVGYEFKDNFEKYWKNPQRSKFDCSKEKGKIFIRGEKSKPFNSEKTFFIEKREMITWFVMLYYAFMFTKNEIGEDIEIPLSLFYIDDGVKFDYRKDFRDEKRYTSEKKEVTLQIGKMKKIPYKKGQLVVYDCHIPELNISLLVDEFGEMIEFKDNSGFEAKIE